MTIASKWAKHNVVHQRDSLLKTTRPCMPAGTYLPMSRLGGASTTGDPANFPPTLCFRVNSAVLPMSKAFVLRSSSLSLFNLSMHCSRCCNRTSWSWTFSSSCEILSSRNLSRLSKCWTFELWEGLFEIFRPVFLFSDILIGRKCS